MIFLTVGSHEPFDRLVKAVDDWCKINPEADVFGQITGKGTYLPQHFKFTQNLDIAAYEATLERTDFMISHAGMGSIISALSLSKPIVVMPRKGSLRETRNDHQIATVANLANRRSIVVAREVEDLPLSIARAKQLLTEPKGEHLSPFAEPRLISFLSGIFES